MADDSMGKTTPYGYLSVVKMIYTYFPL